MSIVRENLLKDKNYRPYCGNDNCYSVPRTIWKNEQFFCSDCGWISEFEIEFIKQYKKNHELQ